MDTMIDKKKGQSYIEGGEHCFSSRTDGFTSLLACLSHERAMQLDTIINKKKGQSTLKEVSVASAAAQMAFCPSWPVQAMERPCTCSRDYMTRGQADGDNPRQAERAKLP